MSSGVRLSKVKCENLITLDIDTVKDYFLMWRVEVLKCHWNQWRSSCSSSPPVVNKLLAKSLLNAPGSGWSQSQIFWLWGNWKPPGCVWFSGMEECVCECYGFTFTLHSLCLYHLKWFMVYVALQVVAWWNKEGTHWRDRWYEGQVLSSAKN